jgi:hypothetical protein
LPENTLKGWQEISLHPREDPDALFTKNGVRSLLSAVPELPGRPISPGETWRNRREVTEGVVRMTLVETYTLTGQDGPSATFEAMPEITLQVVPNPIREGGKPAPSRKLPSLVAAKVEKQSGKSKLTFDQAAGRLVTFSRRQLYEVTFTFEDADGAETARSVKVTTVIEFDMKIIPTSTGH